MDFCSEDDISLLLNGLSLEQTETYTIFEVYAIAKIADEVDLELIGEKYPGATYRPGGFPYVFCHINDKINFAVFKTGDVKISSQIDDHLTYTFSTIF